MRQRQMEGRLQRARVVGGGSRLRRVRLRGAAEGSQRRERRGLERVLQGY